MDEAPAGATRNMTDETFILLRDFIYEQSGIYFADNRKGQLEARLGCRPHRRGAFPVLACRAGHP